MNMNTVALLSSQYPSTHANALPAAGYTIATTTRTAATLANGAVAVLSVPYGAKAIGSSTPMDPNANQAILLDNRGAGVGPRGANSPFFSTATFDGGRPFKLRACGTVHVGATQTDKTVNVALYRGASATLSSDEAIYTSTQGTSTLGSSAAGVEAGDYNWAMEYTMVWDTASDKLVTSAGWSSVAGNYVALATPVATASVDAASKLGFVIAYEFGLSDAANNIIISEFAIDRV